MEKWHDSCTNYAVARKGKIVDGGKKDGGKERLSKEGFGKRTEGTEAVEESLSAYDARVR